MEGIKEARVSARIDQLTKTKAKKELSKHGLSISEFIRMNLTTVANQGLPDYYGMPNETTMAAIYEMIDSFKNKEKIEAISFDDIQKLFDEWGNKLIIGYSKQFKKDVRKIQHNKKWKRVLKEPLPFSNLTPWDYVIKSFEDDKELPDYFYSHEITFPKSEIQNIRRAIGERSKIKVMDLHFDGRTGDCLLIYAESELGFYLLRVGSHSELF